MYINNLLTSIITPCKYLYCVEAFPNQKYKDIRIMKQYRQLAAQHCFILQRKADR